MLDAVARLLRDTLIPQLPDDTVFQARVAANAIDRLADLARRTSSGALEQQVLKKVAHTRQMLGFVASTHAHPDAGRDRERTLYFFGGHSETVGQLRDAKSARCR